MSRSSSRRKTRRLWLKLRYKTPASKETVLRYLLDSIDRGDYEYPHTWRVAIGWSNNENGELKWDEWTRAMKESEGNSPGFAMSVREYLENLL